MLMIYFNYSLIFFFFCSLFIYISKYKHFLLMLLSLESIVLSMFMLLFLFFSNFYYEYFISLYYLTMSVCESALGISLLVMIVRTHGSDKIMMFDNLW